LHCFDCCAAGPRHYPEQLFQLQLLTCQRWPVHASPAANAAV
jgi:hypothetical protein